MKLPLKIGIPVLLAMLAGTALTEGNTRMLLVVASMGIALWTALSLPRPAQREESGEEAAEEDGEEASHSKPGPGGNGSEDTLRK